MEPGSYLLVSIIMGLIASSMNRSGIGWFLISLFLTPILAGIILLIIGSYPE